MSTPASQPPHRTEAAPDLWALVQARLDAGADPRRDARYAALRAREPAAAREAELLLGALEALAPRRRRPGLAHGARLLAAAVVLAFVLALVLDRGGRMPAAPRTAADTLAAVAPAAGFLDCAVETSLETARGRRVERLDEHGRSAWVEARGGGGVLAAVLAGRSDAPADRPSGRDRPRRDPANTSPERAPAPR